MNYAPNAAAKLVAGDIRPRLLFGPADLPCIRQNLGRPAGRKIWPRFVTRARTLAGIVLADDDLPALLAGRSAASGAVINGMGDIGALAIIDSDAQAAEACRRLLTASAAADHIPLQNANRPRVLAGFYYGLTYDLAAGLLSDEERRVFCDWAVASLINKALDKLDPGVFFTPGGNMALVALTSAFITALALHGDRCAKLDPRTMERLITMLDVAVGGALTPDGYPVEDIGYGTHVVGKLAYCIECARRLGVVDLVAKYPRYPAFGRAMLHFCQPWGGYLSNTGDHGDDFGLREFVLPRLAAATGDKALAWLWQTLWYNHGRTMPTSPDDPIYAEAPLGKGRQVPPTLATLLHIPQLTPARRPTVTTHPTAYLCRRRGLVSFRSGWRDTDTLLIFDSSQRSDGCQGHHHNSAGHFSLSALGEYFSIDTGRYNVAQAGHSVTLVNAAQQQINDGWSQATREGRLTDFAPGSFVDTAACDATPQYGAAVRKAERRVALVKGAGAPAYVWVVDAINANDQMAFFDWQMQCPPESTITTSKRGATVTGFRHGNKLDVDLFLPLHPDKAQSPDAHRITDISHDMAIPNAITYLGFDKPENIRAKVALYGRPSNMIHGPVYERPRLVVRFRGWNGRSLALLTPRRQGDEPVTITQLEALPGTIAVRANFAKVNDTIIIGFDHPLLRTDDLEERGNWCVIRRSNNTGRVLWNAVGKGLI